MEEKELKILTCYHCGNTGLMRVEGEYKTKRGGPIRDEGNNIVDYDPVERVEMRLFSCPVCHEATLYKEVYNEEYGFTDTLEYCYPKITVRYDAAIPDHIQKAYEAAEKWGLSTRRVGVLCNAGRIEGAYKAGATWIIPDDAEKPDDARIKSGKYIKKDGND